MESYKSVSDTSTLFKSTHYCGSGRFSYHHCPCSLSIYSKEAAMVRIVYHQYSKSSWLILEDFNAYLSITEKKGGHHPSTSSMNDFREFVSQNLLMEVHSSGFHLTWWNKQVGEFKIMGKLDRMLCNANWGTKYPGWKYKVLGRICLDHSPLMGGSIIIPHPRNLSLKLFNMRCSHPTFKELVLDSWKDPILGHSIFILTQKLKKLKGVLKRWNREMFGNIKYKVEEETKKLDKMHEIFEKGTMTKEFTMQMVDQENHVEHLLQQEQNFWLQKSKTKWDTDNDRSTKVFHAMANRNKIKSLIAKMKTEEGITLDTPEDIGNYIVQHLSEKFKKVDHIINRELIQNIPQNVATEDNDLLSIIPSSTEVKSAVFHLNPDSSPGLDGFSGFFFHHCWDIVGSDVVQAI
ncbi:hypothetical protein IFM89_025156 [Coptis chinensis]|uniref:Uncharacterized protein n=1 Tax=Coptis chinensis TaxID=261450 RepID=A0A835LWL5_9MAGN|nr:hypothetical protein IFM89_025156 [Coptis chinensis]